MSYAENDAHRRSASIGEEEPISDGEQEPPAAKTSLSPLSPRASPPPLSPRASPPNYAARRSTAIPGSAVQTHQPLQSNRSLQSHRSWSPPNVVEDVGVAPATLYLWYRRCTRKLSEGVTVIKVLPSGRIVRRQLFIGAKPEYLELTSTKLFDIAYHLGEIESVGQSMQSPEFSALLAQEDVRRPKPSKCLVINLGEATISLIFKSESDRRDAQFLLRVQKRAVVERYAFLEEIFKSRQQEAGL